MPAASTNNQSTTVTTNNTPAQGTNNLLDINFGSQPMMPQQQQQPPQPEVVNFNATSNLDQAKYQQLWMSLPEAGRIQL